MTKFNSNSSYLDHHSDSGSQANSVIGRRPDTMRRDRLVNTPALLRVSKRLNGAYADATIRAYLSDFGIFSRWCSTVDVSALPTTSETISAFITADMEQSSPATIRRRISSISRIHRVSELNDPTTSETVRLALRRMHRKLGRRQKQALGLTANIRDRLIAVTSDDLLGYRDRAVISLAYDTLRRRSELVALRAEDLDPVPQGGATILVRRSKTDQEGSGNLAYVSPQTLQYCLDWMGRAHIEDGPILRSVTRRNSIGKSLYPGSVGRIYKRLATVAGMSPETVSNISGHSARVGAAQDMAAAGIDLLAIMQAGGWKSPEIVARYVENLDVLRGGSFRLANR